MSSASSIPNLVAGGNVSEYRAVTLSASADNTGLQASAANQVIVGISAGGTKYGSDYRATSGDPLPLQEGAVVIWEAGANITRGASLQSDSAGRCITGVDAGLGSGYVAMESAVQVGSEYPQIRVCPAKIWKAIVGYATGEGGTVTQATNKSTGVTLNTRCGQITMNNASLGAGAEVAFTLTNSTIDATDVVVVSIASGGTSAAYATSVTATGAGSCEITISNLTAGSLGEAVVLNFAVIKAVSA